MDKKYLDLYTAMGKPMVGRKIMIDNCSPINNSDLAQQKDRF